jgi:hypothetical protein
MQHARCKRGQRIGALVCTWFTVGGVMLLAVVGTAAALVALVAFAPPVDYSVGDAPCFVVAGHVDPDAYPDLVVANCNSNSVSVLRNNGNGSFAPAVTYPVGSGPDDVTLGDFDTDGHLDIASANARSNNVSVMLNRGNGTFVAPVQYPVGIPGATITQSLADGDLDMDGDLDLVVTNVSFEVSGNNTVAIFLNNGDGTFTQGGDLLIGVTGPHDVTTGDLDQDGHLDLLVTNRDDNTVFALRNNGNGTFGRAVSFPAVDAPNTPITADVDHDGDLDVITGNFFGSVAILRNDGHGTLALPEAVVVGGEITSVAAGDIDTDGDLDIVAANFTIFVSDDTPVGVLLNNGEGRFTLAGDFGAVGQHALSASLADVDADGAPDVAVVNVTSDTVSILLNQTRLLAVVNTELSATPDPDTFAFDPTPVPGGPAGTFALTAEFCNVGNILLTQLTSVTTALTGGNVLRNGDNNTPRGVGAARTFPATGGYADLKLTRGECVAVDYVIGLASRAPFQFFVDILGIGE